MARRDILDVSTNYDEYNEEETNETNETNESQYVCDIREHKTIILEVIENQSSDKLNEIMKTWDTSDTAITSFYEEILCVLISHNRPERIRWFIESLRLNVHTTYIIDYILMKLIERMYDEGNLEVLLRNQWIFCFSINVHSREYANHFYKQNVRVLEIINYILNSKIPMDYDVWNFIENGLVCNPKLGCPILELFIEHNLSHLFIDKIHEFCINCVIFLSLFNDILEKILQYNLQLPRELISIAIQRRNIEGLRLLVKYGVNIKEVASMYTYPNDTDKEYSELICQTGLTLEEYLRITNSL